MALFIMVDPDDFNAIRQAAISAGVPVSRFLVRHAMGAARRAGVPVKMLEYKPVLRTRWGTVGKYTRQSFPPPKPATEKRAVTLKLHPEMLDALREAAKRERRSMGSFVVHHGVAAAKRLADYA
jgi:uncharacterized protein (DUF1778 family)